MHYNHATNATPPGCSCRVAKLATQPCYYVRSNNLDRLFVLLVAVPLQQRFGSVFTL